MSDYEAAEDMQSWIDMKTVYSRSGESTGERCILRYITRLNKMRDDAMIPHIRDMLGGHSAETDNYSSLNRFLEMI